MIRFPGLPELLAMLVGLAAMAPSPSPASDTPRGNAANGERLFNRRCAGCHALVEHRNGPRLGDVYGRLAGSAAGYRYSSAVAGQTFAWSDSTLDLWLAGPRDFLPGAAMPAKVGKIEERADIIAYLRTVTLSTDSTRTGDNMPSAIAPSFRIVSVLSPAPADTAAGQRRKK